MKKRVTACVCLFAWLSACDDQGSLSSKIRGTWQMEGRETVVRITANEFIMLNDSPVPESYKLTPDSMLLKGFEAEYRNWKYGVDSFKIEKITHDSLVMRQGNEYLRLYK